MELVKALRDLATGWREERIIVVEKYGVDVPCLDRCAAELELSIQRAMCTQLPIGLASVQTGIPERTLYRHFPKGPGNRNASVIEVPILDLPVRAGHLAKLLGF